MRILSKAGRKPKAGVLLEKEPWELEYEQKILTRLSLFLLVLFGVTILTFIYTNLSPVDAAEALAVRRYSRPTPEQVELVREELGLDKPLIQQYGSWLWNALHGDFGNSYNTGRPIIEELTASLGPTITMASLALLFAAIFSIPLGVLSASKKVDYSIRQFTCLGSFPCLCPITGLVLCSCWPFLFRFRSSALWGQTA